MPLPVPTRGRRAASAAMLVLVGAACAGGAPPSRGPGRFPPPPPTPTQRLGPNQPPVIWLGGTLTEVTPDHLEVLEGAGSVIRLRRLAGTATSFFRVSGRSWRRLAPQAQVPAGQEACVETLMDGRTFLALRVFLGAGCGPA